jgi:hypothetical protein
MSFKVAVAWFGRQRWPKVFGSSLGVLLLSAVPALGLIYTGNWIIQQNKQTGGAPHAIIDTSDPASLSVDMGVNSKKNSTSTVIVRRTFQVESNTIGIGHKNRGELVQLTNAFSSLVRDGSVEVTTRIIPTKGSDRFSDRYFKNVGNTTATLGLNKLSRGFYQAGKYTLEITIRYINRKGFWDNDSSGSPHRFTLSSV